MNKINCFLPGHAAETWLETVAELQASSTVNRVYFLGRKPPEPAIEGCGFIRTDGRFSTETIRKIAGHCQDAAYTLLISREEKINFGLFALERFLELAESTGAGMLYSDYFDRIDGKLEVHR